MARLPPPPRTPLGSLPPDPLLNSLIERIHREMVRVDADHKQGLAQVRLIVEELEKRLAEEKRTKTRRTWGMAAALVATALVPTIAVIFSSGAIVERLDTTVVEVRQLRVLVQQHERDLATVKARVELLWEGNTRRDAPPPSLPERSR